MNLRPPDPQSGALNQAALHPAVYGRRCWRGRHSRRAPGLYPSPIPPSHAIRCLVIVEGLRTRPKMALGAPWAGSCVRRANRVCVWARNGKGGARGSHRLGGLCTNGIFGRLRNDAERSWRGASCSLPGCALGRLDSLPARLRPRPPLPRRAIRPPGRPPAQPMPSSRKLRCSLARTRRSGTPSGLASCGF